MTAKEARFARWQEQARRRKEEREKRPNRARRLRTKRWSVPSTMDENWETIDARRAKVSYEQHRET